MLNPDAGRLVRVSEAKGDVLFELNPDVALHWERQDSRILAADVNWPRLLLVIEYAECIGTYHGEQQAAFQTVLLGDIQNGEFVNVTGNLFSGVLIFVKCNRVPI